MRSIAASQAKPCGGDEEPAAHDVRAVDPAGEHRGQRGGDEDADCGDEAPEGGLEGALAEDGLQVLGEEDGEADGGDHGEEIDEDGAAVGPGANEPEVDHRMGEPCLPTDEHQAQHQPTGHSERGQRRPPTLGELLDPVDEGQQRGEREPRAHQVERPATNRRLGLGKEQGPEDEKKSHGGQVDEEDGSPPEVFDERAADDGPEGDAAGHDGGPRGDGLGALGGVLEEVADQGEGGGHEAGSRRARGGRGRR